MRRAGSECENRSYGSLLSVLEIKMLFYSSIMLTLNVYWGHKHATDVNKRFGVYVNDTYVLLSILSMIFSKIVDYLTVNKLAF